ncbi:MAG TPA: ornithine carbamoyltransferase [Firmicutes bacterium]|nr:ornithine carbamoyltransferase [Bacillota bacterium]
MRHLIDLDTLKPTEVAEIIDLALEIKTQMKTDMRVYAHKFGTSMEGKTLLMLFEKPSLRTRVSFEVGMTQLGGHAIFYSIKDSPLGKKESVGDTAKVISRMCDIMMARLFKHEHILELADHSSIPVINALTDFSHPCQILGDLLTIREHFGKTEGLTLAYVGDCNNNVTHSLMHGCPLAGMNIRTAGPASPDFQPLPEVIDRAAELAELNGTTIEVLADPVAAVRDADVVYTDSWMSYHIADDERESRFKTLMPYQVNAALMKHSKPSAIFMNCLPAMRGEEQTGEVIDGEQSVVFEQAENRLHIQKAIMLRLVGLA